MTTAHGRTAVWSIEQPAPQWRAGLRCGTCGLRQDDLQPSESIALLGTLHARWQELLGAQDRAAIVSDRGSGWSALQRLAHVAELLHATPGRLERLRNNVEIEADKVVIDAPHAGDNEWNLRMVLAVLATDADRVAAVAASMTMDDWRHSERRSGVEVSARDVLQEVVHDNVHHLREAACHLGVLAATPPPAHTDPDAWGVHRSARARAQHERRRHPRGALVVNAGVKLGGDGPGVQCETRDVSESGVRLRTADGPLAPGQAFLVLVPSHGPPVASLVELLDTRSVGRSRATDTHARFLRLPPESRVRLGRLIAAAAHPSATHAARADSPPSESADAVGSGNAAQLLHMAPRTVSRWAQEGRLPTTGKRRGNYRFSRTEISAIADRLSAGREPDGTNDDASSDDSA